MSQARVETSYAGSRFLFSSAAPARSRSRKRVRQCRCASGGSFHPAGPPQPQTPGRETDRFQNAVDSAVADRFSALLQAINTGLNPVVPSGHPANVPTAGFGHLAGAGAHQLQAPEYRAQPASDAAGQDVQELARGQQQLIDEVQVFQQRWDNRPELRAIRELIDRVDDLKTVIESRPTVDVADSETAEDSSVGLATAALLNGGQFASQDRDQPDSESGETSPSDAASDEVAIHFEALRIVLLTPGVAREDDEPLELLREWSCPANDDSSSELRRMIDQRDQYIDWLSGQVARIAGKINAWMEHFAERQISGDEADKLKQVRQLLLAEHRTHQVKLSVERGRLFREQSQLQQELSNVASEREELETRRQDCMQALEQLQEHGTADTALIGRLTRFFKRND